MYGQGSGGSEVGPENIPYLDDISSSSSKISIGIQASLTVLQALTMDRKIARHLQCQPAPSSSPCSLQSSSVYRSLTALYIISIRTSTPLQRICLGHIFNTLAMVASALVERKRVGIVHAHRAEADPTWTVPMSVLWLVLPFALAGLGEALHFPGQVSLYYQEFPKSLQSTGTGMIALVVGIGFYASTAVISVVRRRSDWVLDNINGSRLDKVYWMLAIAGTVNFGYFVLCAMLYRYKKRDEAMKEATLHS